jgi:hypothetical protein
MREKQLLLEYSRYLVLLAAMVFLLVALAGEGYCSTLHLLPSIIVGPNITVSPNPVSVYWQVTINGTWFNTSAKTINVNFGDGSTTSVTVQSASQFTTDHIYGSAGTYTIHASDAYGDSASASITVVTPVLTASPNPDPYGQMVTITGTNFYTGGGTLDINFGDNTPMHLVDMAPGATNFSVTHGYLTGVYNFEVYLGGSLKIIVNGASASTPTQTPSSTPVPTSALVPMPSATSSSQTQSTANGQPSSQSQPTSSNQPGSQPQYLGSSNESQQTGADTVPPVTTITLNGTAGNTSGTYISAVVVTLNATDGNGSGVRETDYSFDDKNWVKYSAPFTISTVGADDVYARSIDNAGNVETANLVTFTIMGQATAKPSTPALSMFVTASTFIMICALLFRGRFKK